MANVSRKGFWPVGTMSGSPWQGAVRKYSVDAAAQDIFLGDLVKLEADGKVNVITAVTDTIIGSVVGVNPVTPPDPSDTLALAGSTEVPLAQKYSSGAGSILVCVAPDAIYETETISAQAAGFDANVGELCNVSITAGDTATGLSKQLALTSGLGTAATSQLVIVGVKKTPDNDITLANAKIHVMVNMHQYKATKAGI